MLKMMKTDGRKRLLLKGRVFFARQGLNKTDIIQVCKNVGLTKSAFYYHFKDKDDFFEAVLKDWLGDLDKEILEFQKENPDILTALIKMPQILGNVFVNSGETFPLLLEFMKQSISNENIRDAMIDPYHKYIDLFKIFIAKGFQSKSLAINADHGAVVLVLLGLGYLLLGSIDVDGRDWEKLLGMNMVELSRLFFDQEKENQKRLETSKESFLA